MAPKSKRQKTQSSFSVDEADREKFVTALIGSSKYGHSYCESLGIRLGPNDSDSLYQWLCCSLLMSSGLSEKLTTRVSLHVAQAADIKIWPTCHDRMLASAQCALH